MTDFYERNSHIKRPIPNIASPSPLLDGRSREDILRNVFLETKSYKQWKGRNLWSWIGAMTAHGSGYSQQICEELGWDPDMIIGPKAELPPRRQSQSPESETKNVP